jgi:hypothetical protein
VIPVTELFVERLNQLAGGVEQADRLDVLPVALALRQLLLDSEPLIHQVNRPPVALRIRFCVNKDSSTPGLPKPVFSFPGLAMDPNSFVSTAGTEDLNLDQFLRHRVVTADWGDVTVHDLIDYLCHRAGAVHFVADQSRGEIIVRQLDSYGWTMVSNATMAVVRVVLIALTPLRDAVWRPPDTLPLFGGYGKRPGGWLWVRGNEAYNRTVLQDSLGGGFTFAAALELGEDQGPGEHCLYEIGTPGRIASRFAMIHHSPDSFGCRFRLDDENVISVDVPRTSLRARMTTGGVVIAELTLEPGSTKLTLSVDGQTVGSAALSMDVRSRDVTLQTLGANLEGANPCTAAIGELLLIERGLTTAERWDLTRYLRMVLRAPVPSQERLKGREC